MKRKYRQREYWLTLVEEFENSEGFTQEGFAEHKGVSVGTFRKWLYQIREEDTRESVSHQFVELTGSFGPPPPPQAGVRLILGQRVMLEFGSLPETSYLALLLSELEG